MVAIAIGAGGLGLSRLSVQSLLVSAISAGLILGPLLLARRGLKLIDIVTLWAVALLTLGFLLPAMVQTRYHSAGQRTLPIRVPENIYSFLFGDR
jgi:hypothetical protein